MPAGTTIAYLIWHEYGTTLTVVPPSYIFPTAETVSVNGSSAVGHCSDVTIGFGAATLSRCNTPTTSVLFEGNIPTLTGLDGDMWASQLLTFDATVTSRRDIISDFTSVPIYVGVERIELVMFNCPEKGISVQTISIFASSSVSAELSSLASSNVLITSCDSLVRVCISVFTALPVIYLRFTPPPRATWAFLAEVEFYPRGSTCQPDTIITTPTTTTITTSCKCPLQISVCTPVIKSAVQPFPYLAGINPRGEASSPPILNSLASGFQHRIIRLHSPLWLTQFILWVVHILQLLL
jgi:hypothetical protein